MPSISDFLLFVQVLMVFLFVARLVPSLGSSGESPVTVLVRAVQKVMLRRWASVIDGAQGLARSKELAHYMALAHEYLGRTQAEAYNREREEAIRRAKSAEARSKETDDHDDTWALALVVGLVFVGSVAFVGALWLVSQRPVLSLILTSVLLAAWLVARYRPKAPQRELVTASGPSSWWVFLERASRHHETDRRALLMAMVGEGHSGSASPPSDPELSQEGDVPVAIPPGMTELVFASDGRAMEDVRKEIVSLRRIHRIAFTTILVSWLTVSLGSLLAHIFLFEGLGRTALAGIGFSAVFGGFLWGFLPSLRTSHIALSLYESYSLELAMALTDAEAEEVASDGRQLRAEAWQRFRLGLNQLWRQEDASSGQLAQRFRRASKAGAQAREEE